MTERSHIASKSDRRDALGVARSCLLQRKCACAASPGIDGECAKCRGTRLQRNSRTPQTRSTAPPIVHEVLRSPGFPLDPATQTFMELRFAHNFSNVLVHADARAAEAAHAVGALAYTVGRHVVFAEAQYAPETSGGRKLLAHELAHVIQQGSTVASGASAVTVGRVDDALESEADHAADIALAGCSVPAVADRGLRSVQRACGPSEIGTTAGCIGVEGDIAGDHFLFHLSCDELRKPPDYATDEEARLRSFAATIASGDSIEIHGFASEEGNPRFNEDLSCARALKAQAILDGEFSAAGKSVAVRLFMHGATAGNREERRSVYIDWHPAAPPPAPSTPTAPACLSFPCFGTSRCMTGTELATAVSIFGPSLDATRVRVTDSTGAGGAPWTNFSISPSRPFASGTCLNLGSSFSNATLIHELAHSWQSQHHSNPTAFMSNSAASQAESLIRYADRGCAYTFTPGAPFGEYAAEQIAQIVECHFAGRTSGLGGYISTIQGAAIGTISPDNVSSLSKARVGPPPCSVYCP